ncbi:MAG: hypothetical protein ACKO7P_00990 [Bacteroidota bacterium]
MKVTLVLSILISNYIFCQKEIDTIYINEIKKVVNQEGDLSIYIKTSDGKTRTLFHDIGLKKGSIFYYFDKVENVSISRADYESSIYNKLKGTEYERWAEISSAVHCVKVKKSPFNKFKYKVFTDSPVTYFVNYPPKIGEEVFYITENGRIVK